MSAVGRAHWDAAAAGGAPQEEAPQMGPRTKLQGVSANAAGGDQIHLLTGTGARLTVLRDGEASLRLSASGEEYRERFRDLTHRPHILLLEEAVLAWSSFLTPVLTFALFSAHLEKARLPDGTRDVVAHKSCIDS